MIIRAGGLPRGGPVAERLLEWLAPIARVSGGSGGYPAPHLMRFFVLLLRMLVMMHTLLVGTRTCTRTHAHTSAGVRHPPTCAYM